MQSEPQDQRRSVLSHSFDIGVWGEEKKEKKKEKLSGRSMSR